jgi:hypothetical protein
MSTKATRSTARKVIGSLGVIGAAAAVAGMGTFGTFTDSTTPVTATIQSGTVSIDLTQPGIAIPAKIDGFVPGDSMTRPIDLKNDGNAPLASVSFASTATASSILTTDTANGLQLALRACDVVWTQGGTKDKPTYTCSAGERPVLSGPAVTSTSLANMASLTAGATDHLALTVSLPTGADNTFQNKSAGLSFTFTGTQVTGSAR